MRFSFKEASTAEKQDRTYRLKFQLEFFFFKQNVDVNKGKKKSIFSAINYV